MQERRVRNDASREDAVQEGFGIDGIQYKCDAGKVEFMAWDAGQLGSRTGELREKGDAGKMG